MPLPVLREEIALHPGPRLADGQPSWTLHDPVRNAFFRIDWLTFEILSRWHLDDAQAVVEGIASETTLHPSMEDLDVVVRFLTENELVRPLARGTAPAYAARLRRARGSWGEWLLHHYLFFRVPLVRPDAWLTRWARRAEVFYRPGFFRLTLIALVAGLVLVYRDWDRFSATLVDMFSLKGVLAYGLTLIAVKALHELGHAFTAKRYGCRVPVMGVAFLVLWPVAYTDTNEVWKLADRRKRLAVAAAGVATELAIAAWAGLAWALLPEGTPKAIAFLLATTTWIVTVAINASPFMRFDGYFLLSDWLDMPNLHARAFALARWDLRERLFGLGEAPPERPGRAREAGLILFAYATWAYRLVLFLGIAVLVYHFFIKALGILLFAVEIGWFVLRPLWSEVRAWRERWPLIRARPRARRTAALALGLAATMLVPWPARISSSGLLRPAETFSVYAPEGAQVVAIPRVEGSVVPKGEAMIELLAPGLELKRQKALNALEGVRQQAIAAGLDHRQRPNLQILQEQLATAQAELAGIQAAIENYAPRAPFAGRLRDLDPELRPGVWVSRGERLAVLVQPDAWRVETYLDESAVRRVQAGDGARFYADGLEGPFLPMTVAAIDRDATRVLANAMLAASYGGSVLTREKRGQLFPENAVYRVILVPSGDAAELADHSWRGTVVIRGAWEAPGMSFARAAFTVLWREMGF